MYIMLYYIIINYLDSQFVMLNRLYSWYGKKVVLGVFAVVIALATYLLFFMGGANTKEVEVTVKLPSVEVGSAANTSVDSTFTSVGSLLAVSEAKLQTESGGRIVGVYTELGASVRAGTIIAKLEGASESAQLLQAQGAYEAAVAGARSGEVGVDGAKEALASSITASINTFQSSLITVDNILHNDIDIYFSISDGKAVGFKLDGRGKSQQLNNERSALEVVYVSWVESKSMLSEKTVVATLEKARVDTIRISAFIDTLTVIVQDQDTTTEFKQEEKDAVVAQMFGLRTSINAVLKQLEGAQAALDGAEKAVLQAEIAGSTKVSSASSAQVKIALGSLRAAQANYEKTLVRTPISGVVNALYLKTGEFASPSTPAAIIANNNQGLEVTTSVSQEESVLLSVGDEVKVDKVATGTIAAIGGSIDPTTGKVAVKISVDKNPNLQNGSTVSITFVTAKSANVTEVSIPLAAVKMTGSGPIVFTVHNENSTLVANPVTLGDIRGEEVVVISGITRDTDIVLDGRGQKEGAEVTVINK